MCSISEHLKKTILGQLRSEGNYSPTQSQIRKIVRKYQYKGFQNQITMQSLELTDFHPRGRNYLWMLEFIDLHGRGYEHPLFRILIKEKLKDVPIDQREAMVEKVFWNLSYDEVKTFCYGLESDVREELANNLSEVIEQQQVIETVGEFESNLVDDLIELNGRVLSDDKNLVEEYKNEGGIVEAVKIENLSVNNIFKELDENCVNGIEPVNYHNEMPGVKIDLHVMNSPEVIVERKYQGVSFPLMIYACPGSGKSYFNRITHEFLDTDYMYLWPFLTDTGKYITNMPNVISKAVYSIALIPSRSVFEARCISKKLKPKPEWYSGLIRDTQYANVKLLSNKYLSEVIEQIVKRP